MNVLILYTELAGYVLGNIKVFLANNPQANLILVHYPVNPEAPFEINDLPRTQLIEFRTQLAFDLEVKIKQFNPDVVLCSGWGNKFYLKILKTLPQKTKRVVCFDNKWKGSFKQCILTAISRFYLLPKFKYAWVPGEPQKLYAQKLGFKRENIFTGLYPADSNHFLQIGKKKLCEMGQFPRVFLSIARYIPQKDLPTLWRAFIQANNRNGNNWILKCIGLGDEFDSRIEDKYIQHLGFKQPYELNEYIETSGIYVLPSIEEPWGVAVHEMALSAMPLVLSDKVGAGSMFLNEKNGFVFKAGNQVELEQILSNIMSLDDSQLKEMSQQSYSNGQKLLSIDWSNTLIKILNSK